jgi:thioredoxin-like negative regulator of GroEL
VIERLALAVGLLALVLATSYLFRTWSRRVRAEMIGQVIVPAAAVAPQVIQFSGPRCAACRTQKTIIEQIVGERTAPVEVRYLDAVEHAELAGKYRVMTVPTTVVTASDGRVIAINTGLATADRLRAQLAAA